MLTAEGRVGEVDAVAQRALCGALQVDVDRQPQRVAEGVARLHHREPLLTSARVEGPLFLAVLAAQVRVVGRLDTRLSDRIGRLVALALELLVLSRRDLPDVAEDLRGERLIGIGAKEAVLELNAGELALVLGDVVVLVALDAPLHDHRRQRVVAVLVEARDHVLHADAGDDRKRAELRALGRPRLGQVRRPQHDARAGDVADEQAAVAVANGAARRLDAARPHPVVVRGREVALAREHLERPEP